MSMIMMMSMTNDDDIDHIYQPDEADVYGQSCKNPKTHDEVHLPGK